MERSFRWVACTLVLGAGFAAACGESSSGGPSAKDTDGGGGVADAAPSEGGNTDGGDQGPSPKYVGRVLTDTRWEQSASSGQRSYRTFSFAAFYRSNETVEVTASDEGTKVSRCRMSDLGGGCAVRTCDTERFDAGVDAGIGPMPHAGNIAIEASDELKTQLEPTRDGRYRASDDNGIRSEAEKLAVDAVGGEVPAFHTELFAPREALVARESLALGTIERSKGFDLTWSGGANSQLGVSLGDVTCEFDGNTKTAHVPSEALESLQNGATYVLYVYTQRTSHAVAGAWDVAVTARAAAHFPDNQDVCYVAMTLR
ncbi:hypothetical protein LVJ94_06475 [Pendulispora rubella]|uniref:Lipoprotein n=1 Tax=Pendulispora rubella TaxID=2741070 RepID=A0ABZ2L7G6_9BACT